MRFSVQQDFPTGIEGLLAAFGRADYPRQKYRALGSTAVRITRFEVAPDLIQVELERNVAVAAADLPAWARAFAGKRTLSHRTRWQRVGAARIEAHLEIRPSGLPVEATGTGAVTEFDPGRTRMELDFDVECKVPVIGGRIAQLFARQVQDAMKADHAFTLDYLRAHASRAR